MIAQGQIRTSYWFERLVMKKSLWLTFILIGFALPLLRSFNRELPAPPPVYYQLPDFKLTNQFGESFGSNNLKGKVYIASFIFTSCPTTCSMIMNTGLNIQNRIKNLKSVASLVTFTVDPENDTPKVLEKYAKKWRANPQNWSFLTGDKAAVSSLLIDGFKVPVSPQITNDVFDIAHSEKFVLVDQKGRIRGYYSNSEEDLDKLVRDTGLVVNLFNYHM